MGASTKHSEEGTVDEGEKENDARAEDDDAVSVAVDGGGCCREETYSYHTLNSISVKFRCKKECTCS